MGRITGKHALGMATTHATLEWIAFFMEFFLAMAVLAVSAWLLVLEPPYPGLRIMASILAPVAGIVSVALAHKMAPTVLQVAFHAERSNPAFGGNLITLADEWVYPGSTPPDILRASDYLLSETIASNSVTFPRPPWVRSNAALALAVGIFLLAALLAPRFMESFVELLWPTRSVGRVIKQPDRPQLPSGYEVTVTPPRRYVLGADVLDSPREVSALVGSHVSVRMRADSGIVGTVVATIDGSPLRVNGMVVSFEARPGIFAMEAAPRGGNNPSVMAMFGVRIREDSPPAADCTIVEDNKRLLVDVRTGDDLGLRSATVVFKSGHHRITVAVPVKAGETTRSAMVSVPGDRCLSGGFSCYVVVTDVAGQTSKSAERKWVPPPPPKNKDKPEKGMFENSPRRLARPQSLGEPSKLGGDPSNESRGQRPRADRLDDGKGSPASGRPSGGGGSGYEAPQGAGQERPEQEDKRSGEPGGKDGGGQPQGSGDGERGKGNQGEGEKQGEAPRTEDGGNEGAGGGPGGQRPRDGGPKSGGETGGKAEQHPPDSKTLARMNGASTDEAKEKFGKMEADTSFGEDRKLTDDGYAPKTNQMNPTGLSGIINKGDKPRKQDDLRAVLDKVDPVYVPMIRGYFKKLRESK